jgi:glycine/D-amino acid oxidase-like deaminating enzyme
MRLASTDVVVIGGGVIGLAAAYYLAQAGKATPSTSPIRVPSTS